MDWLTHLCGDTVPHSSPRYPHPQNGAETVVASKTGSYGQGMFGHDDLGSAYAALAELDEVALLLGALTVEGWQGAAASAADQARIAHVGAVRRVREDVRVLTLLLQRREDLRNLLGAA